MRFTLRTSILSLALIAPVWALPQDAVALEKALEPNAAAPPAKADAAADTISIQTAAAEPEVASPPDDDSTVFNGVRVPPLREINGEKFDEEVKSGYWFVKHHSPYCPHCHTVAPIWQTLYEFYYVCISLAVISQLLMVVDIKTRSSFF